MSSETIATPFGVTFEMTRVSGFPITSTRTVWPSITALPLSIRPRYCSPPTRRMGWVGWITTFFAYPTSTLRTRTRSSTPVPALLRTVPSILRIAWPVSWEKPGHTMAVAFFLPWISMASPLTTPSDRIASMLSRAMPRPASSLAASFTITSMESVVVIGMVLLKFT
ncbi:MAG: hypothetical protein A4E38_00827 [Methanoregulaceae archaeon PtaB.Bin108]|nr:MAG: hypothetical protein A4E38_00827 [Methanoregulaceae archaeon PtaB.Bin108]